MKKKKKKKSKLGKAFKYFFITMFFLGLIASVAFGGVVLAMIKTTPALDINSILSLDEPTVLYDNKGEFMDEAPTLLKRESVSIEEIPDMLKYAVISIEDERFLEHNGIDYRRIVGALYTDVKKILSNEEGLHGASTITQQLLKNTILTDEVTIKRKVQEMYLAIQLEKALDKDEILEAYLNTINLGGNVHGVKKAAEQYFDKTNLMDLTLIECAYLAGVTQHPYKYSVFIDYAKNNPQEYINRTKTVIAKMKENGYIDESTYAQAIKDLDDGKLQEAFKSPKSTQTAYKLNYEWFSRPAMDAVKKDLMTSYHYTSEEVEKLFMYGGLKIYTTMDRELQESSQAILNDQKYFGNAQKGDITDPKKVVQPQASAVITDYHTGEVKVIIGGRGEQPANSFNRATSTSFIRPTGSTLKPLTVYAPAIDTKQFTAGSVVEDSPLSPEIGKQWPDENGNPYNPTNYDTNGYAGYVTVRKALARSINLVAIKMEYDIGLKTGLSYAEKFGIHFNDVDKNSLSALSLGQFEGSNTLQMAAAFGTFGNSGIYTSPILYTKVVDKTGKILLENKPLTRKVLSPQSSYIMYDLLKGPVYDPEGTAGRARIGSMPIAGKTGTSSKWKDFWFCGLTPYYSGAVWIGDDKKASLSKSGISSGTAAEILGDIMEVAHKNLEVKDIPVPTGLVKAQICIDSGKQPTDLCLKDPRGHRVVTDYFIEGTVPTSLCDIHVEAKINKSNGKLATENTPADLIESKVFIRRDYTPTKTLADEKWVLPTEYDTTAPAVNPTPDSQEPPEQEPTKPDATEESNNEEPVDEEPEVEDPTGTGEVNPD
ncbi:transglycosylase domain-containing protein [Clostridium thermarum]|uniref:transglycosylase domain-containing protein n=1 Tax=Clostridium thermarum TaxID=1716543 RepID=UPI0013D02976|nr:PBP1A family penicillin-binding protein [Clostridium thermarum]